MKNTYEILSISETQERPERYHELVSKSIEGPLTADEWVEMRGFLPKTAKASWATRGGGRRVDNSFRPAGGKPQGTKQGSL